MVTTILSPHLDDAVLSCWHLLAQPRELRVITVFTGVPTGATPRAWWDRLTGASDSGQRVRARLDEDRHALALAGRTSENLGFLDHQYRETEQPLQPLVAAIEPRLGPGALLYAPAALGDHTDHVLARAAALELRRGGVAVSLYADLPHAMRQGWPAWVTGNGIPCSPGVAAALWERTLAGTGIPPGAMEPSVHRLDPDAHAQKLVAVQAYRTQLAGLVGFTGRALADYETLGYEVEW